MSLRIRLLGTPKVWKSGQNMTIPFKKAEALLYYLLVEKKASRDELAGLLWSEFSDEKAKKNLRNSLYTLKKVIGEDFVEAKQSTITLRPDFLDSCEMDIYEREIRAYPGEFLQGFILKDASPQFDSWIDSKRREFRIRYQTHLHLMIEQGFSEEVLDGIDQWAYYLIEMDELDEHPWRVLMRYYLKQGMQYKAVRTYDELTKILQQELSVEPSAKTQELYAEIVSSIADKHLNAAGEKIFYGRDLELQLMNLQYENFLRQKKFQHLLIQGEAGIGKTTLKEAFLDQVDTSVHILQTQCYQPEKSLYLRPWSAVFTEIVEIMEMEGVRAPRFWNEILPYLTPDTEQDNVLNVLRYQMAEEVILDMLRNLSAKKKVIIVMEDLQWIDDISLTLLSNILTYAGEHLFFVLTRRNDADRSFEEKLTHWKRLQRIVTIDLDRFNREDVEAIMALSLPDQEFQHFSSDKIYRETEGNPFFLSEYLNFLRRGNDHESGKGVMTRGMRDILHSKFVDLSIQAREIADLCSVFFDRISIGMIQGLSPVNETQLMLSVEELEAHGILRLSSAGEGYEFTHQKLRDFAYQELSTMRRIWLHKLVAKSLEERLNPSNERNLYPQLIYHFEHAADHYKKLYYQIKNIKLYLDFRHELFPVLVEHEDEQKYFMVSPEESQRQIKEIEEGFRKLSVEDYSYEGITKLEIEFLHLKGRQLIRRGQYDEGLNCVREMIQKSREMNEIDHAIEGYKQIIYYYRQVHDTENMESFIDEALELAEEHHRREHIGVLLRLKGLQRIMKEDAEQAEYYLSKSLDIFGELSKFQDRYLINIAAAYNYLGDVQKMKSSYDSAMILYEEAMDICQRKKVPYGLYMFLNNAGQIYYLKGEYQKSKECLSQAMELYEQIGVTWGRSVAESYLAGLMSREGDHEKAKEYLQRAERHSAMMTSPLEQNVLEKMKREIETMNKKQ